MQTQIFMVHKRHLGLRAPTVLAVGFALTILVGALVLMLPVSAADGQITPFLDALFTAASASCVTGLVTVSTAVHWSVFGKCVILLLIQIGGLGFMSVAAIASFVLRRTITLHERMVMSAGLNLSDGGGIVRLTRRVLFGTFIIEGTGAVLLSCRFVPHYGFPKGITMGVFHAVSAFCNAGFDLFGRFGAYSSLVPYVNNYYVQAVIIFMIISGGLGFMVWVELCQWYQKRRLSLHAKVVLSFSVILWLGGALGLGLMEWNNPATLGGLSVPGKVMASLFQSVSTRTAGMNTVDLASCGTLSKLLMSVLQFIGAAPGSTGGGVKVTTFAVIILTIRSVAQGRDDCVIADHHIESKTVYRALTIIVLGAAAAIGSAIVVYYNTSDAVSVVDAIFESCSAFGTVGLSVGVTSQLNNGAKILYMLVMFMGRVGPVAFAMSLTAKPDDNKRKIMPVGHINVG